MKELLKVIEVWKKAEEDLNLSSEKGSYTDGFHKGYIHGMEAVKELLSSQPGVEVGRADVCGCKEFYEVFGVHRPGCNKAFESPVP